MDISFKSGGETKKFSTMDIPKPGTKRKDKNTLTRNTTNKPIDREDQLLFNKVLLWGLLILPWFTLFFLKKEGIKRYMPVAIFASLLMTVYNVIAYNQKHWEIKVTIIPWLKPLFVPGLFGGFLIVTIWIFYFTYGRLWKYLITNMVADFMFAIFPIHYWFQEKLGIYQLINITPLGRFTIFVIFALLIYLYQMWQEEVFIAK